MNGEIESNFRIVLNELIEFFLYVYPSMIFENQNEEQINASNEESQKTIINNNKQNDIIEKNFRILEKYPPYEIKPIKWNPPPSYFQQKKQLPPQPEYVPPKRKPPRNVNPENLSDNQKILYGKNLYEKDLEIIKNKNCQLERSRKKMRSSSVNSKVKPPDIFFREENERQQKNEELKRFENKIKRKNRQKEIREKKQYEKQKVKLDEERSAREYERKIQFEIFENERKKEILKRLSYLNSIKIQPDRPTRASALKEEATRKKIHESVVEEKRKKLNKEMKNIKLKEETKKIIDVIDEINPKQNRNEKLEMKKHELRKNEREWKKWLALTEQTNKTRETMLEKIYNDFDV